MKQRLQRIHTVIQENKRQLNFGSYAAEMAFYIIWSIVPIMLSVANVMALLPISQTVLIELFQSAIPEEVATLLIPMLQSYLNQTSTNVFSLGLLLSLWPASNVFNTLQRVLNDIHGVKPRKGIIARIFAYLFTLATVCGVGSFMFVILFGEKILYFIQGHWSVDLSMMIHIVQQSWIFGLIGLFVLQWMIYHFVPNVPKRPLSYSLPGTLTAGIGFGLISQLFSSYIASVGKNATSNGTIGVFIVLLIWLYFNGIVIAVGAYVNVIYEAYIKTYRKKEEVTQ